MKKLFLCSLLVVCSLLCLGADRFLQTTANPDTKMLQVRLQDQWFEINLDTPGIQIRKYPNGTLREIFIQMVNISYQIYFYAQKERQPEKVALIKRYHQFQDRLLLHGKTESYDEEGHLLSETYWEEGKLNGVQKIYNSDFQVIEERDYEQGFPINTWRVYYPSGKVASEITFPKTIEEWQASRLEGKRPDSTNLFEVSFHRPIRAKEIWYNFSGGKQKEREFELSEYHLSFRIIPTGKEIDYDPRGNIIRKMQVYTGHNEESSVFNAIGKIYYRERLWFNDAIFKATEQERDQTSLMP